MERGPAELIDARLAKALAHPLRVRLLAALNEAIASPHQLAERLEEPLQNVSYHVRVLHDLGCIELVSTAQRRGAIEHFYRAIMRPFFSTPLALDEKGWTDLNGVLAETLAKAMDIQAESAGRRSEMNGDAAETRLVMMHFPAGPSADNPKRRRRG